MTDFSHLKGLDIEGKTAECTLSFQTKQAKAGEDVIWPTLTVRPATEATATFANEQLKMTKKTAALARAGAFNTGTFKEARDNDRDLYARYVIVGWKGIYDKSGKEAKFSEDECRAFLRALPDYLFDQIRAFCTEPSNFSDQVSVEAIVKN